MSDVSSATPKGKPLSYAELNVFCEQIALVLKAGISVYEGICILHQEASTASEKALYQGVIAALDDRLALPDALAQTGAFPSYMVQMLAIGECSGRLDTVLDQLARYYKREQGIKDAVRYAVSYPLVMMLMMGAVIAVLVAKVLPIFNDVFVDLGRELTGFSKNVMELGTLFSQSLWVLLVGLVVLGLLVLFVTQTQGGKRSFARFRAGFFLTKKLTYQIAVSRFSSGMSLMLASGLDTQESLEMVLPLVEHQGVAAKINAVHAQISAGKTFAEAMDANQIFSKTYHRMLTIGERTGTTDEVIENISQRYEAEIETNLSNLIAIIEPSLVAVLSVVVGVILLAVMLPLMSIMSVI